jgi:hypothetical protein
MNGGIGNILDPGKMFGGKSSPLPSPKELMETDPKKKLDSISEKLPGSNARKSLLS